MRQRKDKCRPGEICLPSPFPTLTFPAEDARKKIFCALPPLPMPITFIRQRTFEHNTVSKFSSPILTLLGQFPHLLNEELSFVTVSV